MRIKLYQVDAFSSEVFKGNPAAVCPLDNWLDDEVMQAIAAENNLSETAFFIPQNSGYALRWFTPVHEVDLCGHATLAAAHVLFSELGYQHQEIVFTTRSGDLTVARESITGVNARLRMDFPALSFEPCSSVPEALLKGLGKTPSEVYRSDDYLVVFDKQEDIASINPDFHALSQLDLRGVGITAEGDDVDVVSRFFAPKYGIDEDPVTGSWHCLLTPFWSKRLDKNQLIARQISKRGGEVVCKLHHSKTGNFRVILSGYCAKYMEGEIYL